MPQRLSHTAHRTTVRPLVAALALLAVAGAARADDDPNPYYIGVVAEYGHDSNVEQQRKALAKADSYTGIGIVAGLDQPISRQRLYANARVNSRQYQDVSELNHVSYNLAAGVDWATVERLSGNFNVALNQDRQDPSVTGEDATGRFLVKSQAVSFRAQYGLVSLLSLEATVAHRDTDYSVPDSATQKVRDDYANRALKQDSASLGLKYRPSGALTLGSALRLTHGRFPADTFNRHDIDFTADWRATGQSTVNARVSVGKQTFDGGANDGRDWSGATGSLGWNYTPTGRLSFSTQLSRDTGAQSGYSTTVATPFGPNTFAGDDSLFTSALSVSATYEVSAKIRLTANGRYAHRTIANTITAGTASQFKEGQDTSKTLSLTANYQATRNWLFTCNVGRNTRLANQETINLGLSHPYASDFFACSAQFVIQ